MKAIIHTKYGQADVLQHQEIDTPKPNKHEVLIKVGASTVNRTDCAMLTAKPYIMRLVTGLFKPRKNSLGTDFAGKIEAIGNDVKNFAIGDRVFGFNDMGVCSHAEYMLIDCKNYIAKVPNKASYTSTAASIEGNHYARNMVKHVKINKGDKVLVNGATGAIGSACIQLLKRMGADTTAVGQGQYIELIKSLGANTVIDYEKEDFTTQKQTYKYIIDAVGKSTFPKCKPLLAEGGVYISSELGPWLQNIYYALFTPIGGKKKVVFPFPSDVMASLKLTQTLLESKEYIAVIEKTYSLKDTPLAFDYVLSGKKIGNVVIDQNI